jgi:hypothetical protein
MPAKAGIQAGRLRGCLVDSRFRGNDGFGTQLSSWAKPGDLVESMLGRFFSMPGRGAGAP